jgi:hypothetical protein
MSDWIPVSEDLPEVGAAILVYDSFYKGRRDYECVSKGRMTRSWGIANSGENGRNDTITHWMPLPKPPQDK